MNISILVGVLVGVLITLVLLDEPRLAALNLSNYTKGAVGFFIAFLCAAGVLNVFASLWPIRPAP